MPRHAQPHFAIETFSKHISMPPWRIRGIFKYNKKKSEHTTTPQPCTAVDCSTDVYHSSRRDAFLIP